MTMNALITAEEVSALARPIYADEEIVSSIIAESEREDIKPRIGDRLYLTLKTKGVNELTNEESLLLNGGQWTSSNGDVHYLEGLKTALAYFVYSRIVRDGNIQSTRYGARIKSDENSTSTEDTERQRQYRQAFASADRYLAECLAFINRNSSALGECGRDKKMRSNRTKFRVVGTGGGAASSPVCNSGGGILDSEEIIKILGYTPANAAEIPDMSRVYELPDGGIPNSDLSEDVQDALAKGKTASSDLSTFRPEVERALSERVRYADVVDGLESTETDKPLSANQGRVLDSRKQDKTSLVSDLATQVNALSSSDKAAFLGQIGAASEESLQSHENDNTRHITAAERTKWNAKQDAISDLADIRSGASKGATALQSYTESDPIYTADKPSLALKTEIPDVSGKADKTAIVTETEGNASYAISPNVLTKLGTLASSVTLSLDTSKEEIGVTNMYDIIFVTPTDAPSITWPEGITWVGGSAPAIAGGKTYEVSIMDNLATYGEY